MASLEIQFLDVGQGDGTLIVCPLGETILVDFGSKKNANIAAGDAITYLVAVLELLRKDRRLVNPTIDYLMLTHGDGDHCNQLQTLLAAYNTRLLPLVISNVVIGGPITDYPQEVRTLILNSHSNNGTLTVFGNQVHDPVGTPRWQFSDNTVKLYLLSANYPSLNAEAKNPKSLVLMLEYARRKVILTGDAEGPTEAAIIGYYKQTPGFLVSDALKLGHHGSQAGTSAAWLEAVKPYAVFASSDMKWAHPYCDTILRLRAHTVLWNVPSFQHRWICGQGAGENKEYRNCDDAQQGLGIYTTMAYITEQFTQVREENTWYAAGLVQGVQYELQIFDEPRSPLQMSMSPDQRSSGKFYPQVR
jgi:competence protein ComEC